MPVIAGLWLRRHVKQMADTNGGTTGIAHIAEPVADGGEKLTIIRDGDVGLLEALWGVVEITKGLACLMLGGLKHTHPKIDGGVLLIGTEQTISNGHATSLGAMATE
jgi:hypothetical protein